MAAASPEFYKPPAFSPRLHLLVDAGAGASDGDDDEYFRTPKGAGISYLGDPGTCPPAPRKPRPPPGSTCRKRLFDVDVISLRFDDLDAIFRPSKYGDNKQKQQRRRSQGRLTTSGRSK